MAALAPRAFFSVSPVRDSNFDVAGVRKAEPVARKVFELLGAADNLQVKYPECEHDFPDDMRQAAYAFIDRILKHQAGRRDRLRRRAAAHSAARTGRRAGHVQDIARFSHGTDGCRAAGAFPRRHRLRRERPDVRRRDDRLFRTGQRVSGDGARCSKTPTATAASTRAPFSPTSSRGRRRSPATTAASSWERPPTSTI